MKIENSETVASPVQQVFDVFADIPRAAERIEGITELEVLSEVQSGQGLRWRETRIMFGKAASETMEMTAFDPPNSYVVEAESNGTHYTSVFRFAPEGEGTRVTWSFEGKPITLLGRLMSPMWVLFKGATEKALKQDMLDLKKYLETSS